MVWRLEHLGFWPLLDNLAIFHDHNLITDRPHGREVMGYEHVGQAQVVLQLRKKFQNTLRHQLIKRGGHLITDDELRLGGQGASNANALLSARQTSSLGRRSIYCPGSNSICANNSSTRLRFAEPVRPE